MKAEDRREPTNEELYSTPQYPGPIEPSPPALPREKVSSESASSIKSMVGTIGVMLFLCYCSAMGLLLRETAGLILPIIAALLFSLLFAWVTWDSLKEWQPGRKETKAAEPQLIVEDTTTKSWQEWPVLRRVTQPTTNTTTLGDVLFSAGLTAIGPASSWAAIQWVNTGRWPYAVLPWITTIGCSVLFVVMLISYLYEQIRARRKSRRRRSRRRS